MSNQFMKKCSECGSFGAAYQTTNDQGETVQICHECRKKLVGEDGDKDKKTDD